MAEVTKSFDCVWNVVKALDEKRGFEQLGIQTKPGDRLVLSCGSCALVCTGSRLSSNMEMFFPGLGSVEGFIATNQEPDKVCKNLQNPEPNSP